MANELIKGKACKILDQHYFEVRSRLLDLAGIFDRISRGENLSLTEEDPRLARLREGVRLLLGEKPGRAEQLQHLFSLPYDAEWEKPVPRF